MAFEETDRVQALDTGLVFEGVRDLGRDPGQDPETDENEWPPTAPPEKTDITNADNPAEAAWDWHEGQNSENG